MARERDRTPSGKRAGGTRRKDERTDGPARRGRTTVPVDDAREGVTEIDRSVDALFQLPLNEFTAARNALSTRLRKARQAADADAVRRLPRPTLVAWAVNQLYWRHREAFLHLLETGTRFYDAQLAQLSGVRTDLRSALEARREALSDLTRQAANLLREGEHGTAPDTMRRISTTLDALSSGGPGGPPARLGRLTEEVLPQGFDVLAPMVTRVPDADPLPSDAPPRVLPFRGGTAQAAETPADPELLRREARAAARAALEAATLALEQARVAGQDAESALKAAAARAKEAEREKAAAEERLLQLTRAAEVARADALGIAARAEEAAQALDEAERACEAAERRLQEIERGELEPSGG